jgi:glycosyltransferase involved in cell wall biosynthesis
VSEGLHVGIGHYSIGFKDGVNTVIARNVQALASLDKSLRITLFGKLAPSCEEFINLSPPRLAYRNIEEFDPHYAYEVMKGRSISEQQVHDYIWQGTHIAQTLVEKLADMDVVMIENLGIGIHPAVTYAFYLYTQYCYMRSLNKRFIYRCHDFVQQRPDNFRNVRKFYHPPLGVVPYWHSILYPAYPNIRYIAINRYDRWRLSEHGIEDAQLHYIPNPVDESIVPPDDRSGELRAKIIAREGLDASVQFLLYPVRCVRRKNVEEAILLTKLFNCLAEDGRTYGHPRLRGPFHLLVGIKPTQGDDARYAAQLEDFVKLHRLPVTIGLDDLVGLTREESPGGAGRLVKRYSIGDAYRVAELVVTTSTLEGFGFTYIEPWLLERAVIGRNIPFVTPDFQAAGMKLGHLYTALITNGKDFKDIGMGAESQDEALRRRLSVIEELDNTAKVRAILRANETPLLATLGLFEEDKRQEIVRRNKDVVQRTYSQEVVGKQLYEVMSA